jgi:hypothetical protein
VSDWIEKYRPFNISTITKDSILLREAPLLLMDIDVKSNLGKLLISHRSGRNDEKKSVFFGDRLIEGWVKNKYLGYSELLTDIEHNEVSFVDLFKKYLEIYAALKASDLIVSSNTRKRLNKFSIIKVTEFLEWAERKNLKISEKIKAAYIEQEQKKTLPDTVFQPPNIQRNNDFNECIGQVIQEFYERNSYAPTTVEEVLGSMKHKPPFGVIIEFKNDEVSIDNSLPRDLRKFKNGIKRLLNQHKKPA